MQPNKFRRNGIWIRKFKFKIHVRIILWLNNVKIIDIIAQNIQFQLIICQLALPKIIINIAFEMFEISLSLKIALFPRLVLTNLAGEFKAPRPTYIVDSMFFTVSSITLNY